MLSSRLPEKEKESFESGAALFFFCQLGGGVRGEGRVPKSTPQPWPAPRWQPPPAFGDSFYVAFHNGRNDFNTIAHQTKKMFWHTPRVRACVFTAAGDAELTCTSAAAAPSAPRRCVRRAQLVSGPSGWNASSAARAARNRNLFTTRRNAALMALLKMQLVCQHTHRASRQKCVRVVSLYNCY